MMRRLVLIEQERFTKMNRKSVNTWLTDMINISIERFKLLLNEINQIENKISFIIICEDALLSKGASNEDRGGNRECWTQVLGGARSMTGGAGQLIVNMTKTGCYYYYYFIWIIKSLYRRISNVYEECGSIIALRLLHGGAHAIIFIYLFFPAERAYTPVIFGCAFCRLMQSPWMENVTTMNQLTDIRNKSAESLKTN